MLFNFWRPYPFLKPRKSGWYICTTSYSNGIGDPEVIELYFSDWNSKWINKSRQTVFDGYKVYQPCRATTDENRVYTDSACERIDVISWKKLPRCYRWWKKKKEN